MLIGPTKDFGKSTTAPETLDPDQLLRITRFGSGEPYFGRTGANRFDDYRNPKQYGTCYFGRTLNVAFAETVLHDEMPVNGGFDIAMEELKNRYLVKFSGEPLQLLDLTGNTLKRYADPSLSTILPYDLPQKWSVAVHNHPAQYDGFMYMSRHMNTRKAVVLFDRASHKINAVTYIPLQKYAGALVKAFGLRLI